MDRMGTVRTDLWMVGRDLNITFFVQDMGVKKAVENDGHRIGKMLKGTFNTVAISVVVNQKKIAAGVRMILEAIGEDPDREGLRDGSDQVHACGWVAYPLAEESVEYGAAIVEVLEALLMR